MQQLIKKVMYRLRLVLASVLLLGVQAIAPVNAFMPTAHAAEQCKVDTQGANDEPNQKDLTKMCVDYANAPTTITTKWNWDDLGSSGANTLDACSLFDTDGDGFINYSVCVTTTGNPAVKQAVTTYSCGDAKIDRCTSQTTVVPNGTTDCTVAQSTDDPFPADDFYNKDTQANCVIQLSAVGGSTAKLVDVCSYPSGEPNSDPSDCVIIANNRAKIEVQKVLSPSNDSGLFNLKINGITYATNVGDGGTTGEQVVTSGSVTVAEAEGTATDLATYNTAVVCRDKNGTGSIVGQSNPTGADSRQLQISAADQSDIVCVFTNTRQTGTLTVVKDVVNDNGGTRTYADFSFSVNGGPAQNFDPTTSPDGQKVLSVPTGTYSVVEPQANTMGYATTYNNCTNVSVVAGQTQTCTITNNDTAGQMKVVKHVVNDNGGTAKASDFTLLVNGQAKTQDQYFSANAGTYTVTESGPSGYTQTSLTCVDDNTQQTVAHPVNLALGESVTCTVTNDDVSPTLTVIKHVINNNGGTKVAGDFTMNVTGTNVSNPSFAGAENPGVTVNLSAGAYSVGETGPNGYAASYSTDCSGSVAVGQNKTCTITNDDIAPLLTVIKYVVNDNGGLLNVSDFALYVNSTKVTSSVPNVFDAGSYNVHEVNQPGYTAGNWGGDCATDGDITLSIGGTYTCSITNNDQAGKLIVKKVVINDNGGTKQAKDFSFSVNGGQAVNFEADGQNDLTVNAGTYTVSETAATGYSVSYDNCDQVAVANGETQTCTITNNDIAPKLTIKKEIKTVNETDQEFGFSSDTLGTFTLAGGEQKDFTDLQAGDVTVNEDATDGWKLDSVVCTGGEYDKAGDRGVTVSLAVGDNVTCVFTNEQLSTIDGFKFEDVNNNGEWDENEPGLEGWTITLTKVCNDNEVSLSALVDEVPVWENDCQASQDSTVTDEDGYYRFDHLTAGNYMVCEELQSGWFQTFPISQTEEECHFIELAGQGGHQQADFGNFKKGEVTGVKFNDVNGNHKRDSGEPTLKDWTITLTKKCPVSVDSLDRIAQCQDQTWTTKTDQSGTYSFGNLMPGDYKVCEVQQANWTQTYPETNGGCHEFTVDESGQIVTADFGNKPKPQVLSETLVNTGSSTALGTLIGLTILGTLAALHIARRKNYAK